MSIKKATSVPLLSLSPDSEYMSNDQLMFFKQIIEEKRLQIINRLELKMSNKNDGENHSDESDKATAIENKNLEIIHQERDSLLLHEIQLSLKAFASEDYGFCEECGIEIGIKRLKINPSSRYCFDCKCNIETKLKNEKRISF
jgi:DnaK suppressor protein